MAQLILHAYDQEWLKISILVAKGFESPWILILKSLNMSSIHSVFMHIHFNDLLEPAIAWRFQKGFLLHLVPTAGFMGATKPDPT